MLVKITIDIFGVSRQSRSLPQLERGRARVSAVGVGYELDEVAVDAATVTTVPFPAYDGIMIENQVSLTAGALDASGQ